VLTLSFQSAQEVIRTLRCNGLNLNEMDFAPLARPKPWTGKRWTSKEFDEGLWRWRRPSSIQPLHVLASGNVGRACSSLIHVHSCWRELPPHSVIWLDEHSSVVCPELLFLQMAEHLSMPELVMLGSFQALHIAPLAPFASRGAATHEAIDRSGHGAAGWCRG
jgi:hypothetical protein